MSSVLSGKHFRDDPPAIFTESPCQIFCPIAFQGITHKIASWSEPMTNEKRLAALRLLMKKYTKKNASSKEAAAKALVKEGIYTKDLQLSANYGGRDAKPPARRAKA
jgi:hypothetical protein